MDLDLKRDPRTGLYYVEEIIQQRESKFKLIMIILDMGVPKTIFLDH